MKSITKIFLLLFLSSAMFGQQELSISMMNHLANFSKVNPAQMPTTEWTVSGPSFGFSMLHTGPSFDELYTKEASGSYRINADQGFDQFDDNNTFAAGMNVDVLGVTYAWNDNAVSLNLGSYVDAALDYTREGAMLLLKGNGEFIGQTLSVGPALDIKSYDKLGLGFSRKQEQMSFGGRVNLLFGRKALSTTKSRIDLTTEGDYYALRLDADYEVHSSDFAHIDEQTNDVSFSDMGYKFGLGKSGFGVSIDLGVGYSFDDAINVYGSVLNIGSINWKKDATTFYSQSQMTYDGVHIQNIATLDTASLAGMLDSIQQFIGLEQSAESFKTKLGPTFMVGGSWKFTEKTTFTGVIDVTSVMGHALPAVAIGAQYQVAEWAHVGGFFSYQNKKVNHIGLNTTLSFGPVQLFMATDNILTFVMPKSANTLHFRVGANVLFGRTQRRTTIRGLG